MKKIIKSVCQKIRQKNKAFTLVETLIAISIFSVSIIVLMTLLSKSITNTEYIKKKILSVYLAQEGIEYVRNMRDSYVLYTGTTGKNWSAFYNNLTSCVSGNACGISTYSDPLSSSALFPCYNGNTNMCELYVQDGFYNVSGFGSDSGFSRTITTTILPNSNELKVFSTISWAQEGKPLNSITLTENLFNWTE